MKLPPTVLPDADGDGVTDQFDKEPNTPKGCPVDTHGVSLDTDGDGIPDCKDKEPLTKKDCFPVDSLGEGLCPEPPCCGDNKGMVDPIPICHLRMFTINKIPKEITIDGAMKTLLDSLGDQMNECPECSLSIRVYYHVQNKFSKIYAEKM